MPAICCGLAPMIFGRKPLKIVKGLKISQISKISKKQKDPKGMRKDTSSSSPCNIILMMELRKKLLTFRDIIDLPPCQTSVSIDMLLLWTIKDLHKFYPGSIPQYHSSELKGLPFRKVLIYFCKALQELGDTSKMNNEWIDKYKYDVFDNEKCKNVEKLVEIAVATLTGLIKIAKEKFDMMDEDDEKKDCSPKANTFGKVLQASYSDKSSGCTSPVTPTSVLPELINGPPSSPSSSLLLSLRVQSVGKLNPIDLKRLTLHMLPDAGGKNIRIEEQQEEAADNSSVIKASAVDETRDATSLSETSDDALSYSNDAASDRTTDGRNTTSPKSSLSVATTPPSSPSERQPPELWRDIEVAEEKLSSPPEALTPRPPSSTDMEIHTGGPLSAPPKPVQEVLPPSPPSKSVELSADMEIDIKSLPPAPPPPPPFLKPDVVVLGKPRFPSPPTPPPSPLKSNVVAAGASLPKPPPLPSKASGTASVIPPPPPPLLSKGSRSLAPPPPLSTSLANGAVPPPPPPCAAKSLRPKRVTTKLKRSSYMGNLYRVLKGKLEGSALQGKSPRGKKSGVGNSPSGKQGMAEALAEMTKRSAYFQQIEEDVQKYAKPITELKNAISAFSTKDMTELLKFQQNVESILEKLTDETQVLARFEGFPTKKLETLRTASALYLKLEPIITELENWKIEPPLEQLLDKVERYFNKIKGEIDTLERIKDEESKKFKSHNIDFDFQIIVRIKEAIVDVSSNCMELALKERREVKLEDNEGFKIKDEAEKKVCTKMLWKAFQFAFRVYTFAGGQDERADKLTRELAHEIETDPEHQ